MSGGKSTPACSRWKSTASTCACSSLSARSGCAAESGQMLSVGVERVGAIGAGSREPGMDSESFASEDEIDAGDHPAEVVLG